MIIVRIASFYTLEMLWGRGCADDVNPVLSTVWVARLPPQDLFWRVECTMPQVYTWTVHDRDNSTNLISLTYNGTVHSIKSKVHNCLDIVKNALKVFRLFAVTV